MKKEINQNLQMKLVEKLTNKKVEYWKEKFIESIKNWCYKNNTISMKDMYPELKESNLHLAITDGGWVNVLKLVEFMERDLK